jgi:hypothetical protein
MSYTVRREGGTEESVSRNASGVISVESTQQYSSNDGKCGWYTVLFNSATECSNISVWLNYTKNSKGECVYNIGCDGKAGYINYQFLDELGEVAYCWFYSSLSGGIEGIPQEQLIGAHSLENFTGWWEGEEAEVIQGSITVTIS